MNTIEYAARLPHPLNCIADVIIGYARSLDPTGEFHWLGGIYLNQPNNFFGFVADQSSKKRWLKVSVKRYADVPMEVRQRLIPDGYAMWGNYVNFRVTKYEELPDVLTWIEASYAMPYRSIHRKAA